MVGLLELDRVWDGWIVGGPTEMDRLALCWIAAVDSDLRGLNG